MPPPPTFPRSIEIGAGWRRAAILEPQTGNAKALVSEPSRGGHGVGPPIPSHPVHLRSAVGWQDASGRVVMGSECRCPRHLRYGRVYI